VFDRFGVDVPASVWASVEIPDYLKTRVAVVDHNGCELEAGRDLRLLAKGIGEQEPPKRNEDWIKARSRWERKEIREWDFGELPRSVPVGSSLVAYPALEASDEGVSIRLFQNPEKAKEAHLKGVKQLFSLFLAKDLRFLKQDVSLRGRQCPGCAYFGGEKKIESSLYDCVLRKLFELDIRSRETFLSHAKKGRTALSTTARDLKEKTLAAIEAYYQLRSTLERIRNNSWNNSPVLEICALIENEMASVMPQDFLERYGEDRLSHLPRYLKAMEMRAERGSYDPLKHRKKTAQVEVFEEERNRLQQDSSIVQPSSEKRNALEELLWMLEEYKVSLFAQELKTAFPVSSKRLQQKIDEIKRMV